jgi:mono/diheme cytochrome c family protein
MNYPTWEFPASGLLIAGVAILHVFISHFAVGGGLFLVLTERKARREGDAALLDYLKGLTKFFVLLTLVLGAVTGVGIWFTIGLVHPAATSSLINVFVWAWAIEWTFFVAEIAAAMVYYYGWDRMSARAHMAVGWIYFGAAWMSLVVINGILAYMLTPGDWVTTRGFWDGFLNPTYLPSTVARTFLAAGLAGLYALFVASWSKDPALKRTVARWAGLGWVVPMAVALPLSLVWYFRAAAGAGAPVAQVLGAPSERMAAMIGAVFTNTLQSGYPVAQRAAFVAFVASILALVITVALVLFRRDRYGRFVTSVLLALGLLSLGGAEWVREDLRKPYVIGKYMFVSGVRLPVADGAPPFPDGVEDAYALDALNRTGVLEAARWARTDDEGRELFRILCSSCHTLEGYHAIRPLVRGLSAPAIEGLLGRLASPVGPQGTPASWLHPDLRLATWRERRMPPFVGSEAEKRALAIYLAGLGGVAAEAVRPDAGAAVFEVACSACHGAGSDWPMAPLVHGLPVETLYEILGRLDELNDMMPPFDGTDEERRALAEYLAALEAQEVTP